jgi:hypothetical protein
VECSLDSLEIACLKLIERGLLATGLIQFEQVRLAGHDLNVM